jgi:GNAT superfamily N-acetyltransferase
MYEIAEVDGILNRSVIEQFNALDPHFPALQERHFKAGFWWLVYKGDEPVAFAGLVPFGLDGYGYLKRCLVKPEHLGHGLQFRLMRVRELKARQLGYTHLVSECLESNSYSAANFRRAGFEEFEPEQKWAVDSIFFKKAL